MSLTDLATLMRPQQWYKNLVIYLALIFTVQLFVWDKLLLTTLGLASLCLISSSNYVINDVIDRKKDRVNPEKRNRPVASGKIKVWQALVFAAALLASGAAIALTINTAFLLAGMVLSIITQLYSFSLKNAVFVDVLAIATNFVIRAASGALIISVKISPWLILCTFFLSLFLSAGKRAAEVRYLGKKAASHRSVLSGYTKEVTSMLMTVTTTLLIVSYSLYSFLSKYSWLLLTLPFALYTILRYTYLVHTGSVIGRKPEKALKDLKMMAGAALWTVAVILILQLS